MTFNQIPGNASEFLDANILVYYFTPDPNYGTECQLLMERMTNDALILATMQDQAIKLIASHDADFDRVPGITRYAPA